MWRKVVVAVSVGMIVLPVALVTHSAGMKTEAMDDSEMAGIVGGLCNMCYRRNQDTCSFSQGWPCSNYTQYDEYGNPAGCKPEADSKAAGTYDPPYCSSEDRLFEWENLKASLRMVWACREITTHYCTENLQSYCAESTQTRLLFAGWKKVGAGDLCPN